MAGYGVRHDHLRVTAGGEQGQQGETVEERLAREARLREVSLQEGLRETAELAWLLGEADKMPDLRN